MQRVFWFGILKPLDLEGQVSTRPLQRQHVLYTLRTSVFTPAFHININLRNGQNATPKISYIQGSMILVNLNPHQKWFQNHVSKFNCLLCNGKFTIKNQIYLSQPECFSLRLTCYAQSLGSLWQRDSYLSSGE